MRAFLNMISRKSGPKVHEMSQMEILRLASENLLRGLKNYPVDQGSIYSLNQGALVAAFNLSEENLSLNQSQINFLGLNYLTDDPTAKDKEQVKKLLENILFIVKAINAFVAGDKNIEDLENALIVSTSGLNWEVITSLVKNKYPSIKNDVLNLLNNRKKHENLFKAIDDFLTGNDKFLEIESAINALPDEISVIDKAMILKRYSDYNHEDIAKINKNLDILLVAKKNNKTLNKLSAQIKNILQAIEEGSSVNSAEFIANLQTLNPLNLNVIEQLANFVDDLTIKNRHSKNYSDKLSFLTAVKDCLILRKQLEVKEQVDNMFGFIIKIIRQGHSLSELSNYLLELSDKYKISLKDVFFCYEAIDECIKKLNELFPPESDRVQQVKDYLLFIHDKEINVARAKCIYNAAEIMETDKGLYNDRKKLLVFWRNKALEEGSKETALKVIKILNHSIEYSLVKHEWATNILNAMELNIFTPEFMSELPKFYKIFDSNFKEQQRNIYEMGLFLYSDVASIVNINSATQTVYSQMLSRISFALNDGIVKFKRTINQKVGSLKDTLGEKYANINGFAIETNESNLTAGSSLALERCQSVTSLPEEIFNIKILANWCKDEKLSREVLESLKKIEKCYEQAINANAFSQDEYFSLLKDLAKVNKFMLANNYANSAPINDFAIMLGMSLGLNVETNLKNTAQNNIKQVVYLAAKGFSTYEEAEQFFSSIINSLDVSAIPGLKRFYRNNYFYLRDIAEIIQCIENASKKDHSYYSTYLVQVSKELNGFKDQLRLASNERYNHLSFEVKDYAEVLDLDKIDRIVGGKDVREALLAKLNSQMKMHGYNERLSINYTYDPSNDLYFINGIFKNENGEDKKVKIKVAGQVNATAASRKKHTTYNAKNLLDRLILIRNAALDLSKNVEPVFIFGEVDHHFEHIKAKILAKIPFDPNDVKYIEEFYKDLVHIFEGCVHKDNGNFIKLEQKNILELIKTLEDQSVNNQEWDVIGSISNFGGKKTYTFAYPTTGVGSAIRSESFEHKTVNSWDCISSVIEKNADGQIEFNNERIFNRHGSPNILIKSKNFIEVVSEIVFGRKKDDLHKQYIDKDITRDYLNALLKSINGVSNANPDEMKAQISAIINKMISSDYTINRVSDILLSPPEDFERINNIYNYQNARKDILIDLSEISKQILSDRASIVEEEIARAVPDKKITIKHNCIQFNFPMNGWVYLQSRKDRNLSKKINTSGLKMILDELVNFKDSNGELKEIARSLINEKINMSSNDYPFSAEVWLENKQKLENFCQNYANDAKNRQLAESLLHLIEHLHESEKVSTLKRLRYAKGFVNPSLGYYKEGEISVVSHNMAAGMHAMELCAQLDFKVDFFCKSGEDRSGVFHAIYEKFIPVLKGLTGEEYQAKIIECMNDFLNAMDGSVDHEIAERSAPGSGFLQVVPYLFGNFSNTREKLKKINPDKFGKTAKGPHKNVLKDMKSPSAKLLSRSKHDLKNKNFELVEDIKSMEIELADSTNFINQLVYLLKNIHTLEASGYAQGSKDLLIKMQKMMNIDDSNETVNQSIVNIVKILRKFVGQSGKVYDYEYANALSKLLANSLVKDTLLSKFEFNDQKVLLEQFKVIFKNIDYLHNKENPNAWLCRDFLVLKFNQTLEEYSAWHDDELNGLFGTFLNKKMLKQSYNYEDIIKLHALINKKSKSSIIPLVRQSILRIDKKTSPEVSSFAFSTSVTLKNIEFKSRKILDKINYNIYRSDAGDSLTITKQGNIATWKKEDESSKQLSLELSFDENTTIDNRREFVEKQLRIYWECKNSKKEDYAVFATKDNNDYLTQILMLGTFCEHLLQSSHNIDLHKVEFIFCNDSILELLKDQNNNLSEIVDKVLIDIKKDHKAPLSNKEELDIRNLIEKELVKYKQLIAKHEIGIKFIHG